ncbi:hypothetical protein [Melghirimyces algeriensis]|uniref:Uncharacterized protein n=1 Tax=Melghirimyces algeriensis TaxID=910412 RepID=A0A521DR37_9BACL|nr:hypothetical protein [Melghirimyces algeriensis]SMO73561.1 hypothetical protein SAMN06264849_106170 [Melghirimyces algeriensis]
MGKELQPSPEQEKKKTKRREAPETTEDSRPGYGNKKLEGPDRPST